MHKFGLIGYPIAHSLSPRLFRAAYGGRFRYDLLESEDFGEAFSLFMKSYDAVNVTAPFKELAFEKAKVRSPESELCGAANILVKTSRGLSCFNSDCTAVRAILEDEGAGAVRSVLVAGCGGAGKAAAAAAYMLGMDVTIVNRNMMKALDFARRLDSSGEAAAQSRAGLRYRPGTVTVLPADRFQEAVARHDALVYTLPVPLGMFPFLPTAGPVESALKLIVEANYRDPSFTPEVLGRFSRPVKLVPGGQWLLQQALTGYGLMTGVTPDSGALCSCMAE